MKDTKPSHNRPTSLFSNQKLEIIRHKKMIYPTMKEQFRLGTQILDTKLYLNLVQKLTKTAFKSPAM